MYTIPDKGEGDNDIQSIFFQEDLEVLVAGIAGIDCVLSGLDVTGGADMTPAVAKGAVLSNRTMFAVAAADVTITTADATNPRIDYIVVNSSGALAVRAGTAAAAPKPPARTANDVVIASVYVPANDTAIATSQIKDRRVFPQYPVTIYKTTTAETTNNTTSAIHILNKANSGVTIPSGLFLAGKTIRVRIGGNILINSGTPTVTLAVTYGGTTMFSDTSAAAVTDTDRRPFLLDFDIVAQSNSDQAMVGVNDVFDILTLINGPATGLGEAWGQNTVTQETNTPIAGSAAVNSDAANRLLAATITFSVANTLHEVVIETATVELV